MTGIKVATLCLLALVVPMGLAMPAQAFQDHGHSETADGHEEHAAASPLTVNIDLAVVSFVVFMILLMVLWKFAWGPISEGLDKREQNIADHIAAAEAKHEEAKALLAQYDQRLAEAAGEVREIIEEARRDAEHTQKEILAKATEDALVIQERGRREIETATSAALKELSEKSAALAVDLAGKIVQAHLSPDDHSRLIGDAVNQFSQPSSN